MLRMRRSQVHNLFLIIFPVTKKIYFFIWAKIFNFQILRKTFLFFYSQNRFYQKTRPKYAFGDISNLRTFVTTINRIKMLPLIIVCDVFITFAIFYHFPVIKKNRTLKKKYFYFLFGPRFSIFKSYGKLFYFFTPKIDFIKKHDQSMRLAIFQTSRLSSQQ
jgi:hypothetical protein